MVTYPHMLSADAQVWSRFLERFGHMLSVVWYDVHVGRPIEVGPEAGEAERRLADGVGKKRVDVVCRVHEGWWVVEVKPVVSTTALGQVLVYRDLVVREHSLLGEVWAVIVAGHLDPDLLSVCDDLGVGVFTV
jgi:hypothetical protein